MRLFILIILMNIIFSLPRFSVEESTSCMTCHINPTGGAMRNDYGSNVYTLDELTVRKWIPKGDEDWDGYITDNLQLGGEFRIQSYDGNSGSGTFPMQAELYANIDINKDVNIYFELPMGQNGLADNYDIFLLFDNLPANMWLKIGKTSPNYGLMIDDHTSFIKAGNGSSANLVDDNINFDLGLRNFFNPSNSKPIMIESGFNFGKGLYMTLDISQALQGYKDKFVNYTSSITYLKDFDSWSLMLGSSIMKEEEVNLMGFFGGFSISDFSATFEVDRAYDLFDIIGYKSSLATYAQFVYKPVQGFHLIAKYDFFDYNESVENGAVSRYTYGFEFFPLNMLEVKFQIRNYKTNYSINDVEVEFDLEYLLQFHAWF